jgi:hypothetical protein
VVISGGYMFLKRAAPPLDKLVLTTNELPGLTIDLPKAKEIRKTGDFNNGRWEFTVVEGSGINLAIVWQKSHEAVTREESLVVANSLTKHLGDIQHQQIEETKVSDHSGFNIYLQGKKTNMIVSTWYCLEHQRQIFLISAFNDSLEKQKTLQQRILNSLKCHQGKAPQALDPNSLFAHPDFSFEEGSMPAAFNSNQGELIYVIESTQDLSKVIEEKPEFVGDLISGMMGLEQGKQTEKPFITNYKSTDNLSQKVFNYKFEFDGEPANIAFSIRDCTNGNNVVGFFITVINENLQDRIQSVFSGLKCKEPS